MIVDTNALSAWREGEPGIMPIIDRAFDLVIPAISIGEYLFGIQQSREHDQARAWLDSVIRAARIAVVGLATAEAYSRIRANLRAIGRPIPHNDLWIAAVTVEHNLPILSRDRHFDAVDGLTRIGW